MAAKLIKPGEEFVLQVGQSWCVPTGRIDIVEVGKTLAHYRYFKGEQKRGGRIDIRTIVAVIDILRVNGAKLA